MGLFSKKPAPEAKAEETKNVANTGADKSAEAKAAPSAANDTKAQEAVAQKPQAAPKADP